MRKKIRLSNKLHTIEEYKLWDNLLPAIVLGILFTAVLLLVMSAVEQHLTR